MSTYTDAERFLQEVFGSDYGTHARFAGNTLAGGWKEKRSLGALDPTGDCYLSIAAFLKGSPRLVAKALEVRCLVIDDVGELIPDVAVEMALGTPTGIVSSSAAGCHWWYRLSTPVAVEAWPAFIAGVMARLGYTLHGSEAHHVFRLPMGVYSNPKKPERHGFRPALVELNPGVTLDPAKITPVHNKTTQKAAPSGGGAEIKLELDDLRLAMSWIKNDARFDARNGDWVNVIGHGLKALCVNDAEGLTVFDEWSQPHYKYDEALVRKAWVSFGVRGLESKGGKLKGLWQAANPDGFAKLFAPKVFDDAASVDAAAARAALATRLAGTVEFILDQQKSARRVLEVLGGTVRKVGKDNWRQFDPATGRWLAQPGNHMLRLVEDALERRRAVSPLSGSGVNKKSYLSAVAELAAVHASVIGKEADFDADPLLLGTPSGVIDLRAGGLRTVRAGGPGDMVSRSMRCDPAPAGTIGPIWSKFLREFTQGDRALEEWLQIFAGYCLTGLRENHVMPFIYGSGTNGKSVFVNALRSVWGEYGKPVDHRLLFEKAGGYHLAPLAALSGCRLATVMDVPQDAVWDMHVVKMLVSDDPIEANRMHQDPIVFELQAKFMVSGNHQPTVKDMDEGVKRRLRLLPMTREIDEASIDLRLGTKLRGEYGAIFRWALDGLDKYWKRGRLGTCSAIKDATDEYTAMLDPFGRWIETLVPEDGKSVKPIDLYRSWDGFRSAEGCHGTMPNSAAALVKKMKAKKFTFSETNGYPYLRGYKLGPNTIDVF